MQPENDAIPDHSIEAEQALLGAILVNNAVFPLIERIVTAEAFFEPMHGEIFTICAKLISHGKLATPITIKTFMPVNLRIGGDGGSNNGLTVGEYVARLASESTTLVNAPDYARTICDLHDRRMIVEVGGVMNPRNATDPVELAQWAIEKLDEIVTARTINSTPAVSMEQAAIRALDAATHAYSLDGAITGIPYGLADLDKKTMGMERGDLVVIAGRPGMGKTAIALGVTRNMAERGFKVMFESLEMKDVALAQRMMSDWLYDRGLNLTYWQIRSGRFSEKSFYDLRDATIALAKLPIHIEQQPGVTIQQIANRARLRKRRHGLDVLIIDHLGLAKASNRYAGNKVYEIGEITGASKALAKELDCAVILLSQLSRQVEQRDDKRPTMSDLRSSGDIEQDADVILMLYREAYYLEMKEPPAGSAEHLVWMDSMEGCRNKIEVMLAKQRAGPIGSIELFCDIGCNAVRNLSGDPQLPFA